MNDEEENKREIWLNNYELWFCELLFYVKVNKI